MSEWVSVPLINGWSSATSSHIEHLRSAVFKSGIRLSQHSRAPGHYIEDADRCADCGSKHVQYAKIDEQYIITHHCEDCWVIVHVENRDEE